MAGVSSNDLWFSGADRLLLHWDGARYTAMSSPAEGYIMSLWGLRSDDIWGTGQGGALIHWDGQTWVRVCSPVTAWLHGLAGTGRDDVWAAGDKQLLHFDGQTWSTITASTPDFWPEAVFSLARDNVWVAGEMGGVEHWDGQAWSNVTPEGGGVYAFFSIWGTGPSNLWLHGRCVNDSCRKTNYVTYHWDGSAWAQVVRTSEPVGVTGPSPDNGWGLSKTNLFHWNGTSWETLSTYIEGPPFAYPFEFPLLATPEGQYWIDGGMAYRWNGGNWDSLGNVERTGAVERIAQRAMDDAWAVGDEGFTAHFDGTRWTPIPIMVASSPPTDPPILETGPLGDVALTGAADAWIVGKYDSAYHWDGSSWTQAPVPSVYWGQLKGVWGAAPDDVWAIGNLQLLHYDGKQWSDASFPAGKGFDWIGGTSARDVWVTSNQAQSIWHWDGASWTRRPGSTSDIIYGFWVDTPDDVWVSEDHGYVEHWDGKAWTRIFTGANVQLGQITGSGPSDVWIKVSHDWGDDGLLHWDGATWSRHDPPVKLSLTAIKSRAPGVVWVAYFNSILSYQP